MESAREIKQILAARLRELRHAKGWSQERLAEEADMHRTYLAGIERALRNPALENITKGPRKNNCAVPANCGTDFSRSRDRLKPARKALATELPGWPAAHRPAKCEVIVAQILRYRESE